MPPTHLSISAPPTLRALSLVARARGDRADAGARIRASGNRTPSEAIAFDDLPRGPSQCRDALGRLRLPGNDRAVARGARRAAAKTGKAGVKRRLAPLCAGAPCRSGQPVGRHGGRRPAGFLEGETTRATTIPAMGHGLEPEISRRLLLDFPGDETMRISNEAIYQALYIQGRGPGREAVEIPSLRPRS